MRSLNIYKCMKKQLLFLVFIFTISSVWSQTNQRIDISGIILSENQDIEGVTIFNTSSNQGTITNEEGEFSIKVTLNDRIEISALQFNQITLTVNEEVISSKQIKIYLIEKINQLDAVLLSSGLIGNMAVDIDNVKTVRNIDVEVGDRNKAFEYNDDKAFDNQVVSNNLNSITRKGEFYNGVDFVQLAGGIYSLLVKPKNKVIVEKPLLLNKKPKTVMDVFSNEYIIKNFNIPEEKLTAFIGFLESKEMNQELFISENELKLIDYVMLQSNLFIEENDIKN